MESVVTTTPRAHWRHRRVFLTGATGLLGGWVLSGLLERGADVVALRRDSPRRSRAVDSGMLASATVVSGCVEDHPLMLRILNEYEIQTVIHLAAQTIVPIANNNPLSTFESNIKGTWSLLEACRQFSAVDAVVVASSDKAYGEVDHLPYTEDTPLAAAHPYDVSKACADLLAQTYHRTFGVPVAITRCGNLFGAGDLNFNRLIPGTIRAAILGERPVVRSDGTLTRDYIYAEDIADAYLLLAEALARDPATFGGQAFNFSNEEPKSVLEVVEAVLKACGRTDLEPEIRGGASNEIERQFLAATKARRMLAWGPRNTFGEGLDRTIPWYRNVLEEGNQAKVPQHG